MTTARIAIHFASRSGKDSCRKYDARNQKNDSERFHCRAPNFSSYQNWPWQKVVPHDPKEFIDELEIDKRDYTSGFRLESGLGPGCVKTPTRKLRVEFPSRFRRCRNQLHWQLLSEDGK